MILAVAAESRPSCPGVFVADRTTRERRNSDVLDAARPLPPDEDVLINDLTEDEDRLFPGCRPQRMSPSSLGPAVVIDTGVLGRATDT